MNHCERINGRGMAAGWHALELQRACEKSGETMAARFERMRLESNWIAFSVPAKAMAAKRASDMLAIDYQFLDGSTATYRAPYPKRGN